jgi:hypothetical protein
VTAPVAAMGDSSANSLTLEPETTDEDDAIKVVVVDMSLPEDVTVTATALEVLEAYSTDPP